MLVYQRVQDYKMVPHRLFTWAMGSIMGFFDGIYDLLVGSSSYKHIQSYKRDDLLR